MLKLVYNLPLATRGTIRFFEAHGILLEASIIGRECLCTFFWKFCCLRPHGLLFIVISFTSFFQFPPFYNCYLENNKQMQFNKDTS
ncbi:uncharacterized protein DS421_3g87320 [Arachis hypogaea]|nr:uncharacterized protein DS421_3g87320 [Arachis hypogaea]